MLNFTNTYNICSVIIFKQKITIIIDKVLVLIMDPTHKISVLSTLKCVLSSCLQFQHCRSECAVLNIDFCAYLTHEFVTFNVLFTVVLNEPACNTAGIYSEILGTPHPPRNAHFLALLGHWSVRISQFTMQIYTPRHMKLLITNNNNIVHVTMVLYSIVAQ